MKSLEIFKYAFVPAVIRDSIDTAIASYLTTASTTSTFVKRQEIPVGTNIDYLATLETFSSKYIGTLSIGLPADTLKNAVSGGLVDDIQKIGEDASIFCLDLLKIIFDTAKQKVNENGFDFGEATLQAVYENCNSFMEKAHSTDALLFRTQTDFGDLLVIFSLKLRPEEESSAA